MCFASGLALAPVHLEIAKVGMITRDERMREDALTLQGFTVTPDLGMLGSAGVPEPGGVGCLFLVGHQTTSPFTKTL
jgi:hypothetical protein